jgi:hypothetical protein
MRVSLMIPAIKPEQFRSGLSSGMPPAPSG